MIERGDVNASVIFRLLGLAVVVVLTYLVTMAWNTDSVTAPDPKAAPDPAMASPGEPKPSLAAKTAPASEATHSLPAARSAESSTEESTTSQTIGIEELRSLLMSGGDPNLIDHALIEATLEKNGRTAALLAAAAVLESDPEQSLEYLEEALEKDPTSPGILSAHLSTLASLDELDDEFSLSLKVLREVDPKNALPDYYDALVKSRSGDTAGAIEAIQRAGAKGFLSNYGQTHTPSMEEFYRAAECSDSAAKALSTFNIKLDHLMHLREVNRWVTNEVSMEWRRGNHEAALALARDGGRLGANLSGTSTFLVSELVGMACERRVLEAELAAQTNAANANEIDRIERLLAGHDSRRDRIRRLAKIIPEVTLSLPEDELLRYLDQILRVGEDTAAMSLPEVRARLLEPADSDH